MKALTICQPYAELIARGDKPIENRMWATSYRGPLLIHAGKSREWLDEDDEVLYPGMPFGAFVAVADLVACLHVNQAWPNCWRHLVGHEHANGPWCWVLENVRRFDVPLPAKGAQGLWESAMPIDARILEIQGSQATGSATRSSLSSTRIRTEVQFGGVLPDRSPTKNDDVVARVDGVPGVGHGDLPRRNEGDKSLA